MAVTNPGAPSNFADVAISGGHIYWGFGNGQGTGGIGRANLDGSGADPSFATAPSVGVGGIVVSGGYIYFADNFNGTIGRVNVSGTGLDDQFVKLRGAQPVGLVASTKYLYWADSSTEQVGRVELNGSGLGSSFVPDAGTGGGLALGPGPGGSGPGGSGPGGSGPGGPTPASANFVQHTVKAQPVTTRPGHEMRVELDQAGYASWTVPAGVRELTDVTAVGAQGGDGYAYGGSRHSRGGNGTWVDATGVPVTPGEKLVLIVGLKGRPGDRNGGPAVGGYPWGGYGEGGGGGGGGFSGLCPPGWATKTSRCLVLAGGGGGGGANASLSKDVGGNGGEAGGSCPESAYWGMGFGAALLQSMREGFGCAGSADKAGNIELSGEGGQTAATKVSASGEKLGETDSRGGLGGTGGNGTYPGKNGKAGSRSGVAGDGGQGGESVGGGGGGGGGIIGGGGGGGGSWAPKVGKGGFGAGGGGGAGSSWILEGKQSGSGRSSPQALVAVEYER